MKVTIEYDGVRRTVTMPRKATVIEVMAVAFPHVVRPDFSKVKVIHTDVADA